LPASGAGQGLTYAPAAGGWIDIHYSNQRLGVDYGKTVGLAAPIEDGPTPVDWDLSVTIGADAAAIENQGLPGADFFELPTSASRTKSYKKWEKDFLRWIRQHHPLVLYRSKKFKMTSVVNESEGEFRARLTQKAHELRDIGVEKLRRKYANKYAVLENRRLRAEQSLAKEMEQVQAKKVESVISFGTAILGAFLGRKAVSSRSVSRMGTAMKSAGRLRKEKMDVARAKETIAAVDQSLDELNARLQNDIEKIENRFDPADEQLEQVLVKARSTDIRLELFGLLWLPYRNDGNGRLVPDWK
jgi:hypothetical protein